MALRGHQRGQFRGPAAEDAAHHLGKPQSVQVIVFILFFYVAVLVS